MSDIHLLSHYPCDLLGAKLENTLISSDNRESGSCGCDRTLGYGFPIHIATHDIQLGWIGNVRLKPLAISSKVPRRSFVKMVRSPYDFAVTYILLGEPWCIYERKTLHPRL